MRSKFISLILVLASIALTGCVTTAPKTSNAFDASELNRAAEVRLGKVTAVKEVEVKKSGLLGAVGGGIAGAFVGDMFGSTLLKIAGAAGGAYAGHKFTAEVVTADELTLLMNDGKTIVIIQERSESVSFRVGDAVRVTTNGEISRVSLSETAASSQSEQPSTSSAVPAAPAAARVKMAPAVKTPQVTPTKAPASTKRKAKVIA